MQQTEESKAELLAAMQRRLPSNVRVWWEPQAQTGVGLLKLCAAVEGDETRPPICHEMSPNDLVGSLESLAQTLAYRARRRLKLT